MYIFKVLVVEYRRYFWVEYFRIYMKDVVEFLNDVFKKDDCLYDVSNDVICCK